MNNQDANNQDTNNQSIVIEDLETENSDDIKGGPRRSAAHRAGTDDVVVDGKIITGW